MATTRTLRHALAGLALASVLPLAACKKDDADKTPGEVAADDPGAIAEDGNDAHAVETNGMLLTSTLVATTAGSTLSVASAAPGDLSTADVGDATKALFFPRRCLDVTHDPATRTVTYVFTGCLGPAGLARVQGKLVATYAAEPGKLTLDLVASSLQLNGATVDFSAHADIVAEGVARTMTWKGQLSGVNARGREISRTTDKKLTWTVGERCLGVSGTSEGRVRGRNLRTVVTDYERCQRACPEAGGRITTTNLDNGKTVELRFDGSDRAIFVGAKGTESTIPLLCTE